MNKNAYYSEEVHGPYQVFDLGDFVLEKGDTIRGCKLAYKTVGELNVAKDNVILVPTWYSGTHQIIEQVYIGKGRALDPEKYFIIIINQIGNGLSSSPHEAMFPQQGGNFPEVQISDDVRAQHQLLTEEFSIEQIALVMGGSMGAQQTYEWAIRYPDMVKRAAPIAGTAKVTTHNFLFTQLMIDSITSDPSWDNGWYGASTDVHLGLSRLAKLFAMMGWSHQFFKQERWLALGFSSMSDFITGFMVGYFGLMDPNNLLSMAKKWQRGDVSHNRDGDLSEVLAQIKAKTYVLAIEGDLMFPPDDCETEHLLIPDSEYRVIQTTDGHFALFGTDSNYLNQVDKYLNELLSS